MDDKVLRQIVIDELDFEPSIDAANIGVAVENGVVTLTGHVGSYAEKRVAERAVQRVRGVRAIAEEIAVRYPNDKKTANDQIADRAVRILDWYAQIPKGARQSAQWQDDVGRNRELAISESGCRIRRPTPVGRHRCDKPHRNHPTGPSRRHQRENL